MSGCACTHTYTHTHGPAHTCMHINTHIRTHMRTLTHSDSHTHVPRKDWMSGGCLVFLWQAKSAALSDHHYAILPCRSWCWFSYVHLNPHMNPYHRTTWYISCLVHKRGCIFCELITVYKRINRFTKESVLFSVLMMKKQTTKYIEY